MHRPRTYSGTVGSLVEVSFRTRHPEVPDLGGRAPLRKNASKALRRALATRSTNNRSAKRFR
ncbi:hypothetical protein Atai01_27320 [Amycolatopsis taiwanensis]|uniref:Uncharacterized protein n=1 Tax=Amycolatopsis taiwanensis TaxID=342230 RepID=A0A9W6VCF6_9PSEU|nr:hypothetical protein Atai01_27320 [Amycolatopsis taiwanensis]